MIIHLYQSLWGTVFAAATLVEKEALKPPPGYGRKELLTCLTSTDPKVCTGDTPLAP